MSIPSQAALAHLRAIKPNDGWSVQKVEGKGFRLLRRNAPLSDNHFQDIHYCSNLNLIVGVLAVDGSSCQVLVDEKGRPVTGVRVVAVSTYDPQSAKGIHFRHSRAPGASTMDRSTATPSSSSRATPSSQSALTPQESQDLVKYGLMAIGVLVVLKILANADLGGLLILALPLVYFYGLQTCPLVDSFDAKKELKRVLRGHHLPEDHPNKPKGFLEEMAARVTASVTAELATLPGYELEMTSLGGAAWIANVTVPTSKLQCYWVGAFGKWHYVASFETPDTHVE